MWGCPISNTAVLLAEIGMTKEFSVSASSSLSAAQLATEFGLFPTPGNIQLGTSKCNCAPTLVAPKMVATGQRKLEIQKPLLTKDSHLNNNELTYRPNPNWNLRLAL